MAPFIRKIRIAKLAENMEQWNELIIENLDINLTEINEDERNIIIRGILDKQVRDNIEFEEIRLKWINYMTRRGLL